jgi:hypothetical protein
MLRAGEAAANLRFATPSAALQEYFLSVLSQPREPRGGSASLEGYGPNGEGLLRGKSFAKRWLSRQFLSKASAQCGILCREAGAPLLLLQPMAGGGALLSCTAAQVSAHVRLPPCVLAEHGGTALPAHDGSLLQPSPPAAQPVGLTAGRGQPSVRQAAGASWHPRQPGARKVKPVGGSHADLHQCCGKCRGAAIQQQHAKPAAPLHWQSRSQLQPAAATVQGWCQEHSCAGRAGASSEPAVSAGLTHCS